MNQERLGSDGANVSNSVETSQGVRHKTTAPIPAIHALYDAEMALREAWREDSEKYRHTTPRTSQSTLHAWWAWTRALWEEESEAR